MFFKNRCNITAVLVAGLLGISMVTGLTACGGADGTKVVFTTGFGKNEVFRIGDESCSKAEIMIYLTTIQNQYANVYGTEIWNTSLNGVTLEDNVKETVLARIAQIKTMYLLAKEKEMCIRDSYTAVQSGDRSLAYYWVAIIMGISFFTIFLMNYWMSYQERRGGCLLYTSRCV